MTQTRSEIENRTLTELIRAEIRQALIKTRCTLPGVVVTFDGTKARVRPLIKTLLAPDATPISLPEIVDVPVCFPVSSGGASYITVPIKAGDTGTLTFFDRDMARWLYGDGKAVEPESVRIHDLTDASFTPDLTPFDNAIGASTDNLDVVNGDMSISMLPDGKIKIENSTAELIDLLSQILEKLVSTTVATTMGPQPLSTAADFTAIKLLLDTLKG